MPTPETQKTEHSKEEPKEAGVSGGAPAEANPPTEIELVSIDFRGRREVKVFKDNLYYFALESVANYLLDEIIDIVKDELLEELPYSDLQVEAIIRGIRGKMYFEIEVKGNKWVQFHIIKRTDATYFMGGVEIGGFDIYVRAEAVFDKRTGVLYYEIIRTRENVRAIEEDIRRLLESESL
jgi:hypothetical protein